MGETVLIASKHDQLLEDMHKDPEGYFWRSVDGDRRLPPWYQGMVETPQQVRDAIRSFVGGIPGLPVDRFEARHNWFEQTICFIRWCPEWEEQTPGVSVLTFAPLELDSWSEDLGFRIGPQVFALWWMAFVHSGYEQGTTELKAMREREDAERTVSLLSQKAMRGVLTNEEEEELRFAYALTDPEGEAEHRDFAGEVRGLFKKMADENG